MSTKKQIKRSCESGEDGHLGRDLNHAVRVGKEEEHKIEDALGLKMISIRLPEDLIQAYKDIAEFRGISGYQPLMRDALKRFAESEMKIIMNELAEEKRKKTSVKAA